MKIKFFTGACLISLILSGCGTETAGRRIENNNNTVAGIVADQLAQSGEQDSASQDAASTSDPGGQTPDGLTDAAWDYYPEEDNTTPSDTSVSQDAWAYIDPEEFPTGDTIDLTQMSANMVYATVLDMFTVPSEYEGKRITMDGTFSLFNNAETGALYYACIIKDATACCSQGMEFLLGGNSKYPDDYPAVGDYVKVTGTFELYEEDGKTYCHLANAVMEETKPVNSPALNP